MVICNVNCKILGYNLIVLFFTNGFFTKCSCGAFNLQCREGEGFLNPLPMMIFLLNVLP